MKVGENKKEKRIDNYNLLMEFIQTMEAFAEAEKSGNEKHADKLFSAICSAYVKALYKGKTPIFP